MKKGQVYEATVERVDFPNRGIARAGEETIVVKNSLPGQRIKLSVNKVRNGKAEGRLLEVLEKSPLETGPTCSLFGVCGGCTYLSLSYEEQLKIKEAQVKRLLEGCLGAQRQPWVWEGIKASPIAYGYRNKMEFSFGDEVKDGPLTLGMHKRGSFYDVVTVADCSIVDEDYRLILKTVQGYFDGGYLVRVRQRLEAGERNSCQDKQWQKTGAGNSCRGKHQLEARDSRGDILQSESGERMGDGTASGKAAGRMRIRYFHRLLHEGYLRHLVVRKASRTGEILVALVTTSQDPWGRDIESFGHDEGCRDKKSCGYDERCRDRVSSGHDEGYRDRKSCSRGERCRDRENSGYDEPAAESAVRDCALSEGRLLEGFLHELLELEKQGLLKGHFAGILHIVNDSHADVVRSDRTDVLYGEDCFYEELLGLRFKVSIFSFFQTNTTGAEVLYETVREYVGALGGGAGDSDPDKVVFDLYSGTGTIAQLMAPVAGKVIGVEIVEEAVEAARRNAEENGLENCFFLAGDVLRVLDEIRERPDLIILDPPRDGIHPKALPKIAGRIRVKNILYISCKPTSLVRDLEQFMGYGYVVTRACCVDMFPHTANIETVCRLELRE